MSHDALKQMLDKLAGLNPEDRRDALMGMVAAVKRGSRSAQIDEELSALHGKRLFRDSAGDVFNRDGTPFTSTQ